MSTAKAMSHPEEPSRPNLRQRFQAEARRQLLQAGARAFSHYGYHGASIAAVAREAGVGHGTFYLHFADKQALFAELLHQTVEELLQALTATRAGLKTGEDSNIREIETIVDYAIHNKEVMCALANHGIKPQEAIDRFCRQREQELQQVQKTDSDAETLDPVILARAEVGLILSVMQWWLENDQPVPRSHLIRNLVALRRLWLCTAEGGRTPTKGKNHEQ